MKKIYEILYLLLFLLLIYSCERDYGFRGGGEGVVFSVDTLRFDTIFTSIGSATKHFRLYNPYGQDLTIENIRLAGGEDSKFRVNINGIPEYDIRDMELRSGDSIFVFVDVTIDPDENSDDPFVLTDSIKFFTKNQLQSVKLLAYGQNVELIQGDTIKSTTFTNDRPYLVYDHLYVDTLETLTIEPGVRIHFFEDATLRVQGSLDVQGTKDEPVLFSGFRQEEWYADKPGQWGYIYLMPGSQNHSFNYAEIRNATMGIVIDEVGLEDDTPVSITNTKIEHIAKQGLFAQNSALIAANSLFGDCGSASVALTAGGDYQFFHSTVANYYQWGFRGTPALVLTNYLEDAKGNKVHNVLKQARFVNCIIYGQAESEFLFDFYDSEDKDDGEKMMLNFEFDHSLIRTSYSEDVTGNSSNFTNVILNENPLFVNPSDYNFKLDSLSPARHSGTGYGAEQYPVDILGKRRDLAGTPDLGFVQFEEGE
ncbi:hypothetical protein QA597_05105 [Marinilabiliaceae bacterium ANBcel2]|nr:hypothetical protein [Marinilabiliaceae bacterium ANBcel2]